MVEQRTVAVRLDGNVNPFIREMAKASAATKAFAKELDTSTDRSTMLTQSLLAVAPALVPISAAAVPAVAGLTNQLAFAAAGAGVAALAFQGVGDALKATNEYAIDPTDANLQKMRESLAELGPAGQEFVAFLQQIRPELQDLQDAAQEGLFPGIQDGIESLTSRLPQVERIITEVASAMGDLIGEAGQNLASPRWTAFFDFLENEARPTLIDMGRTLGNFAEGFANLWMAFDPVSDQFSAGFLQMSRDFSKWTAGLSDTEGFQEFLDYVTRVGPQVWDTLGSLGNALLQVVEAAAPVGEVALPVIEAIADAVAAVAGSDVGPLLIGAAAGISAISRAVALYNAANGSALTGMLGGLGAAARAARDLPAATSAYLDYGAALSSTQEGSDDASSASERLGSAMRGVGRLAGTAAGVAFVMSDLDDQMGITNTATLTLAGSMAGPWGAAAGAAAGLALDFAAANDEVWAAVDRANQALMQGPAGLDQQRAALDAASKDIDKYKASLDIGTWEIPNLKDGFNSVKNDFEGIFGKSDVEELNDAQEQAEEQYKKNQKAAKNLAFEEAGLGEAMRDASNATRESTQALIDNIKAHNDLADKLLAASDGEIAYEQALDDANERISKRKDLEKELAAERDPKKAADIREELETYSKSLDTNTQAGRDNKAMLDTVAGAWNNLTPAQQNAEGAADRARSSFIKVARQMGATKSEAETLANALLDVPPMVPVDVSARGLAQTKEDIDAIIATLDRLPKSKDIHIRTYNETYGKPSGGNREKGVPGSFTGMRVPDGYAVGGRVPGTPPSDPRLDNILGMTAQGNPLMLRSREWIINEKSSDENDRWLRAINNGLNMDDLFGRAPIPGFVSGGRVDGGVTKLDIKEAEARIRDIQRSLDETETVKRNGKKVKRKVLRGLDEEIAKLQLTEAKKALWDLKNNTEAKAEAAEKAQDEADKAADLLKDAADKAEDNRLSAKSSAAERFSIGSATSAAQVDRDLSRLLNDSNTFLGLLGDLKGKGASPWLLGELVKAGPTKGAIKLAREYNTNQAAFDSIQARAGQIDAYSNAYAGLVGNAAFMAPGPWNSGISSASQAGAQITINVAPSAGMSETNLANILGGQLAWRMN